jgi:hypothetical protein
VLIKMFGDEGRLLMNHARTVAVAAAVLFTGVASASAAPPAAPAWVSHYHLTTPATPSAPATPAPLFSLFGVPVSVAAPVRAPYCTCVFSTFPGQYGSTRSFPPGPPVQRAD